MGGHDHTNDVIDPDAMGTNSFRHTWVSLFGLVAAGFVFFWNVLNFSGLLNAITHSWDNLLLSSALVAVGVLSCAFQKWQADDILENAGSKRTIKRAALINDLEFYKILIGSGVGFLIVSLTVYIQFHEADGNSTYPHGWYISNVTNTSNHEVYTTKGTMKLLVGKVTMAVGFLIALWCIIKYFLSDQGGVIAAVDNPMGGHNSFASKPAKNEATTSILGNKGSRKV